MDDIIENMKSVKCYYCDEKAEYVQPEKDTGVIIDVCITHFTFKHWG